MMYVFRWWFVPLLTCNAEMFLWEPCL